MRFSPASGLIALLVVSERPVDILIVGGGVIGLSLAWRLRQRGASVSVLERGAFVHEPGGAAPDGQASWAAAGVLSPLAEQSPDSPLVRLGSRSLQLYPSFLSDLSMACGENLKAQGPGLLRLACSDSETKRLRRYLAWGERLELPMEWLSPSQVREREPVLGNWDGPGLLSPNEQHVSPRELLNGLRLAALNAGVKLHEHATVSGFITRWRHIDGVESGGNVHQAGQVVLAAGAWSGELARMLDVSLPIRPVRGQVLSLSSAPELRFTLHAGGVFLLPRGDQLLVGSTEEDAGFRSIPTAHGVRYLLNGAIQVLPKLAEAQFETAWAGLRPATPDHLPVLGPAPGWDNLHFATGHFRKGILLAPLTANWMTGWVLDRRMDETMAALSAERF